MSSWSVQKPKFDRNLLDKRLLKTNKFNLFKHLVYYKIFQNIYSRLMTFLGFTGCSNDRINITVDTQPAILSHRVTIKMYAGASSASVSWKYINSSTLLTNTTRTKLYSDNNGYFYLEILNTTNSDETMYRVTINNTYYCDITLDLKSKLSHAFSEINSVLLSFSKRILNVKACKCVFL